MTDTKHTPGPWVRNETWGLIVSGDGEVAALHSGNEANARLIAAAPELLAALEDAEFRYGKRFTQKMRRQWPLFARSAKGPRRNRQSRQGANTPARYARPPIRGQPGRPPIAAGSRLRGSIP
jgi:hypothetical protein